MNTAVYPHHFSHRQNKGQFTSAKKYADTFGLTAIPLNTQPSCIGGYRIVHI